MYARKPHVCPARLELPCTRGTAMHGWPRAGYASNTPCGAEVLPMRAGRKPENASIEAFSQRPPHARGAKTGLERLGVDDDETVRRGRRATLERLQADRGGGQHL